MTETKIMIAGPALDVQVIERELRDRGLEQDIRVAGSGSVRSIASDALNYVSLVADIGKDLTVGLVATYIYDSLRGGSRQVKLNGTSLPNDVQPEQIQEHLRASKGD